MNPASFPLQNEGRPPARLPKTLRSTLIRFDCPRFVMIPPFRLPYPTTDSTPATPTRRGPPFGLIYYDPVPLSFPFGELRALSLSRSRAQSRDPERAEVGRNGCLPHSNKWSDSLGFSRICSECPDAKAAVEAPESPIRCRTPAFPFSPRSSRDGGTGALISFDSLGPTRIHSDSVGFTPIRPEPPFPSHKIPAFPSAVPSV
jgi:hypothetical protein